MDKFANFISYLKQQNKDEFYINLKEIEEIIKAPLCNSAYKHQAYWSADGVHSFADSILECGYKVSADLKNKRIRLYKVDSSAVIVRKSKTGGTKRAPRKTKRRNDVPNPTKSQVEKYLKRWDKLEDYSTQEKAINLVFNQYNKNDKIENILIKSSILNDFYSTNIFKIYPVAKRILSLNIDERLKAGDPTLVDEIAANNIGGKKLYLYSFASKYCSHHNQLEFPIYDSYVEKVLLYFKGVDQFFEFKKEDLREYSKFKNILIEFRRYYKLDKYNLKQLDKFLWQFGKKYFPKKY